MEASSYQVFAPSNLFQLTWTHPQTDKLLFEAGATTLVAGVPSLAFLLLVAVLVESYVTISQVRPRRR